MKFHLAFAALFAVASVGATNPAHQQLVELAKAGNGVIKLDPQTFDLLTAPKRTWSAAIQLTALDKRRRCAPCKEFEPSFNAVAKAWTKVPKEHKDTHFFASLDFDEGPIVFQKLGLSSAPVVYFYPPTEGPRGNAKGAPQTYDFSHGFAPERLAQHLSNNTPVPIPYKAPIDWARWITLGSMLVAGAVTLRFIAPVLQSKWTWAIGTIATSLIMTSGHMFVRIRGMPYASGDGNWIAAGYQSQFGQEVHVIALIYGVLSLAFLMLILVIPYQASPARQRIQVYLWSGVILLVYSVLITIFRVKNRGYPFKLLM